MQHNTRFASSDDDSVHGADEKVSAENALLKKQLEKKEEVRTEVRTGYSF